MVSFGPWVDENIFGKSQFKGKTPELPESYAALMGKQGVLSEYDKQKALEQELIRSGQETPVSIAQEKNAQKEMQSRLNVSNAGTPTSLRGYGKQDTAMLQAGGMQQIARDTAVAKENEAAAARANQGNILGLQAQGQGAIYGGIAGNDRMMDSAKVGVQTGNSATASNNANNAMGAWGGITGFDGGAFLKSSGGPKGNVPQNSGGGDWGGPSDYSGEAANVNNAEIIQSDIKNKKDIKKGDSDEAVKEAIKPGDFGSYLKTKDQSDPIGSFEDLGSTEPIRPIAGYRVANTGGFPAYDRTGTIPIKPDLDKKEPSGSGPKFDVGAYFQNIGSGLSSDKKNKSNIKQDGNGTDALMKISESLAAIAGLNEKLNKLESKKKRK